MATGGAETPAGILQDPDIIAATSECEKLFTTISAQFRDEKKPLLSPFGRALLQQHIAPGSRLSVAALLDKRLKLIQSRQLTILIAGEQASGKTTLLNILMGGSYLPMSHGKTTMYVCEIHHSLEHRRVIIKHIDKLIDDQCFELPLDSSHKTWVQLRASITTGEWKGKKVDKAIIHWPLCVIQETEDKSLTYVKEVHTDTEVHQLITNVKQYFHTQKAVAESNEVLQQRIVYHNGTENVIYLRVDDAGQSEQLVAKVDSESGAKQPHTEDEIDDLQRLTNVQGLNTTLTDYLDDGDYGTHVKEAGCVNETRKVLTLKKERRCTPSVDQGSDAEQKLVIDPVTIHGVNPECELLGVSDGDEVGRHETRDGDALADTAENESGAKDFKIVFIDCPGIKDKDVDDSFQATLDNVSRCQAFMFVIDNGRDHGVEEKRLKLLMDDVKKILDDSDTSLNPDASLFISNKLDYVPANEQPLLKETVLRRLQEKWPLIGRDHYTTIQGSKILSDMVREDNSGRDGFYSLTRDFITQVARLSLEEHCMWLLNLLEVAYALVHTGKQWSAMAVTRQRLGASLRESKIAAFGLQETVGKKVDNHIRQKFCKIVNKLVCLKSEDINNITWTSEEIKDLLPNELIDGPWEKVSCKLSEAICTKIAEVLFAPAATGESKDNLQKRYMLEMTGHYKREIAQLQKLETSLQGVFTGAEQEGGSTNGLVTYLFPVAMAAAVRMAPAMFPFIFLLAPLAPVPLVIASIVEDIRENIIDENHRISLRANKLEFAKKWSTKFISKLVSMSNPTSTRLDNPLFLHLFGDSPKVRFDVRLTAVQEALDMLLAGPETTHGDKRALKACLGDALTVYAGNIMAHNIQENDVTWVLDSANMRVKIGWGCESNVYEAELQVNGKSQLVAVKEYTFDPADRDGSLPGGVDVYRECFLLRQLSRTKSRHIVQFIGTGFYQQGDYHYLRLFLERCLGDLKVITRSHSPRNTEDKIKEFLHYAHETALGVKFLHDNNIVHRDVKPSNYLLHCVDGERGKWKSVKIADFGSAKPLDTVATKAVSRGTPVYWSPEVADSNVGSRPVPIVTAIFRLIANQGRAQVYHTMASDVYSLGLVFWELWNRTEVYNAYKIREGEIPGQLPHVPDLATLFKLCLERGPNRRATIGQLVASIESAMQKHGVLY